eukprot:TRINITY_DN6238_c0_g1_i1.p1 TRINITY_DN6238_c0_g1~~TRINITY_DN6238_c0_g1_i1.p1  ORF type:complete len:245 (+),score=21.74 TRINITY_DN6238_c0_g1_i1:44-778(+)
MLLRRSLARLSFASRRARLFSTLTPSTAAPTMKAAVIPVSPFEQNCSLLWCQETKKAVVIDPGDEYEEIVKVIKKMNVQLDQIWITHGHVDHISAAKDLCEAFSPNIPIYGPHEEDEFLIKAVAASGRSYGFAQPGRPFTPKRWLRQDDKLSFGKIEFEVRTVPGHTPGSVAFYSRQQKLAFVGDVLFSGSIGRTDFEYGNGSQLLASIRSQLFTLPDDTVVVPGHGPTTTIGHEKKMNPYLTS